MENLYIYLYEEITDYGEGSRHCSDGWIDTYHEKISTYIYSDKDKRIPYVDARIMQKYIGTRSYSWDERGDRGNGLNSELELKNQTTKLCEELNNSGLKLYHYEYKELPINYSTKIDVYKYLHFISDKSSSAEPDEIKESRLQIKSIEDKIKNKDEQIREHEKIIKSLNEDKFALRWEIIKLKEKCNYEAAKRSHLKILKTSELQSWDYKEVLSVIPLQQIYKYPAKETIDYLLNYCDNKPDLDLVFSLLRLRDYKRFDKFYGYLICKYGINYEKFFFSIRNFYCIYYDDFEELPKQWKKNIHSNRSDVIELYLTSFFKYWDSFFPSVDIPTWILYDIAIFSEKLYKISQNEDLCFDFYSNVGIDLDFKYLKLEGFSDYCIGLYLDKSGLLH